MVAPLKETIEVTLENVKEAGDRISRLCLQDAELPQPRNLLKLGSYVGEFCNGLRKCLNYPLARFADVHLRGTVSNERYRGIARRTDFPCNTLRSEFDIEPFILELRANWTDLYLYLEQHQAYHQRNLWLRRLLDMTNVDKHEVINSVVAPGMTAAIATNPDGSKVRRLPQFAGDKLLDTNSSPPHMHDLPFYYRPFQAYATTRREWVMYFVLMKNLHINLPKLIEDTPTAVKKIVDDLIAFI